MLTSTRMWGNAAIGGLVGGVGMGLIMHYVMEAMPLIGALYGQPTVMAGWIAHLFHSVVFALIFAAVVTRPAFSEYGIVGLTGLGAVYGIVLELFAAGVVLPMWANAAGVGPLPVPFIIPIGFVTHLLYGVLLGVVFAVLMNRDRSRSMTVDEAERPVV